MYQIAWDCLRLSVFICKWVFWQKNFRDDLIHLIHCFCVLPRSLRFFEVFWCFRLFNHWCRCGLKRHEDNFHGGIFHLNFLGFIGKLVFFFMMWEDSISQAKISEILDILPYYSKYSWNFLILLNIYCFILYPQKLVYHELSINFPIKNFLKIQIFLGLLSFTLKSRTFHNID